MVNNNNFFNIKYDKAFDVYYRFLCTFWNILPQDTEEDLKRYKYLLPLSVFCKMATLIFFAGGTIFHLYIVKRDKIDVATSEDLSIIFSMIGILSVDLCFPFCSKGWTKIIQLLTDFSEFGKPPKIDELTVLGNKRAIGIIIFYFMCAVFYELVSILQAPGCYKDAEKKGLEVNCLTMFPLWLPFDISKMTQLIISLIQYVLLAITTMPAGLGIHLPWEVSEHTYLYIQHLNTLFHYTFETDDKVEQRRRLNKWIKYHHKVVSLVTELNTLTKGSIGVLSLVCSLVVAVTVNQVLKGEKTFAAIVVGVGWFYSLTINCITGQAIINQTASITTNIQSSKWYKGDIPVKKDILFAIMCSQRPFTLNALPLGTLNLELLLMVVQTSYSYVTLLANTT